MLHQKLVVMTFVALLAIPSGANAAAVGSEQCTVQAQIVRGGPALQVPGVVFVYGSHIGTAEVACYSNLPVEPYTTVADMAIQVIENGEWTDKATTTCEVERISVSVTPCTVVWGEDLDELPALSPRRLVVDVSAPEDLDPYIIQSVR